jgi:hypothetical protein
MSVSPDPPKKGDTLNMKANVTFSKRMNCKLYGGVFLNLKLQKKLAGIYVATNAKSLFSATYITGEQVTSGEMKVNLAINKIPFISTNLDLCSTISQAGLSCPISAGSHSLSLTVQIPDEAPAVS